MRERRDARDKLKGRELLPDRKRLVIGLIRSQYFNSPQPPPIRNLIVGKNPVESRRVKEENQLGKDLKTLRLVLSRRSSKIQSKLGLK
jgi:hypothetical protein